MIMNSVVPAAAKDGQTSKHAPRVLTTSCARVDSRNAFLRALPPSFTAAKNWGNETAASATAMHPRITYTRGMFTVPLVGCGQCSQVDW